MMNNVYEDEEAKIISNKVNYYFENGIAVHIGFKKGYWKRGFIKEVGADFFLLQEFIEGKMPVFYIEVEKIEEYRRRGKT